MYIDLDLQNYDRVNVKVFCFYERNILAFPTQNWKVSQMDMADRQGCTYIGRPWRNVILVWNGGKVFGNFILYPSVGEIDRKTHRQEWELHSIPICWRDRQKNTQTGMPQ